MESFTVNRAILMPDVVILMSIQGCQIQNPNKKSHLRNHLGYQKNHSGRFVASSLTHRAEKLSKFRHNEREQI